MDRVSVEYWEANWKCPKCGEPVSDLDDGVSDDGDEFKVVCTNDVDKGGLELEECGHAYSVLKN